MGRRKKAAKKVIKKAKPVVAKVFKCIFCNHDQSVHCALDFKSMTGELSCRVCDAKFQTSIHTLSDPIDVFSEWLDETSDRQIHDLIGGDNET
jgi:transcription elongation factor Elf1